MKVYIFLFVSFFFLFGCSQKSLFEYKAKNDCSPGVPVKLKVPTSLADAQNRSISVKMPGHPDTYPVQLDAFNMAYFVPTAVIKAGTLLQIHDRHSESKNQINISQEDGYIICKLQERVLLKYAVKTIVPSDSIPRFYQRSGFIHPLNTYAGHTLTMDFPRGHLHQHGLFKAWVNTTFRGEKVDFWNQKERLGTVRHKKVIQVTNGPVFSSFSVALEHLAFINLDTVVVLDEIWTFNMYPLQESYWMEWSTSEQCSTPDVLRLNQYHYGGAAFRGTDLWNLEKGAYDSLVYISTSEGKTHIEANHSRPDWVAMFGHFQDELAGIAMCGHPQNFRYPQPIRVHPTMPYFCFAPMVTGPFTIEPGEIYKSRYGILVFDGQPSVPFIKKMQTFFHGD